MKDEILLHLDHPTELEKLYRSDRNAFRRHFNALYPSLQQSAAAAFWHARLNLGKEEGSRSNTSELIFVIIASLVAGLIAKLPAFLSVDEEFFYTRNIGFIVFPALAIYFAWKNKLSDGRIVLLAAVTLGSLIFINLLPGSQFSDLVILSCVHLAIVLWFLLGFSFVGQAKNNTEKRLAYLSYNGELLVMTTLIVIAGFIMTAVTIGLFKLIGLRIEEFYFKYIVVFALPAAPIVGTYLIRNNPQLVGRVSPVIARIFSPLVLLMLIVYLGAMAFGGNNPYTDRDFLMVFNALLLGVMAIIFFSIAEASKSPQTQFQTSILLLLSLVTIVVNGIALSAILQRISAWGFSPNRAAVLGGNVLILVNLLLVTVQLFRAAFGKNDLRGVRNAIAWYLPVYFVWAAVVCFLFPVVFRIA